MGDVVGPGGVQVNPLEAFLRQAFHDHGYARVEVARASCPAPQWRATARRVARQMGRPVNTMVSHGVLHAALTDWPRDPREEAIQRAAMRRAVETLSVPPGGDGLDLRA